ncbi:SMI1/KNR4 family protein [Chloroflexota bacterium]
MNTTDKFITRWNKILEILHRWKPLGFKEVMTGAKLIGHIPAVAPEAWLHCVYSPLNIESIKEIERRLDMPLPISLIILYSFTNGMNLFSDSISIWGVRENYIRTGDAVWQPYDLVDMNLPCERPRDANKSIVFIGGYNWDGSSLYYDAKASSPEAIYRCSRDSVIPLNQWTDLWAMLEEEIVRLSCLYGEDGLAINPDTPTIPSNQQGI